MPEVGHWIEGSDGAGVSLGTVIVRVATPLDLHDPWQLLDHPELVGQRVVAWDEPNRDRCFVAWGVATRYRFHGAGRFAAASDAWRGLDLAPVDVDASLAAELATVPIALAGFAFRPREIPDGAAWQGWPDGALWVPEVVVQRRGAQTVAVFTQAVSPERASEVEAELHARAATVCAAIAAHVSGTATRLPESALPALDDDPQTHQAWCARVRQAQAEMARGHVEKVVLARSHRFQAPAGGDFDPVETARSLRARQLDSTTFLVRRACGQAFVGATPEELVRFEDGVARTVALAGTRQRGENGADRALQVELMQSAKDREEQSFVQQAIQAALAPIATEIRVGNDPEILPLPDVQHLRTAIEAEVKPGVDLFEIAARLHPTPAVGGLPGADALRWLSTHEGLDRGWYAGPLGWIGAEGNGAFVVAIRSALLDGAEATAFAGCGLVPGSEPEAEWEEALAKLATVRKGLVVTTG